jgi:hypothetical protein
MNEDYQKIQKPESEASPTLTNLLYARSKAIAKCIEEMGGEKNADGTTDATRATLLMISREAAGKGFDAGVAYMESKL